MEKSNPSLARLIWQYTRPMALLMSLLFYVLGLAIADYLATPLQWQKAIMGLTCILLLQLVCTYTKGFYDFSDARADRLLTPEGAKRRSMQELRRIQLTFLVLILTVLTAGAVLTVSLLAEGWLNLDIFLILGTGFALAIFYAVTPIGLVYRGLGELVELILLTNLAPALAFILQNGRFHRLLPMVTFPVTALYLAMLLAHDLPGYARDMKGGRKTIMTQLGWQRGMHMHNLFVFTGYFLLLASILLGLPWRIGAPALLTLPIGLFQVWLMIQISRGAKPRWRLLSLTSFSTAAIFAYLLIFSLFLG